MEKIIGYDKFKLVLFWRVKKLSQLQFKFEYLKKINRIIASLNVDRLIFSIKALTKIKDWEIRKYIT